MINKYLKLCLLAALMLVFFVKVPGQKLKVITFNIRYDNPMDGENNWHKRKKPMVEMLIDHHPEIIGIQEGLYHQLFFLDSSLTSYKYIGIGREDGKEKGEYCAIFFDTTKITVIENSTFWLSERSDTVSVGWDAALKRICSYGLFEIKTLKKKILVFNTHFDHMGVIARERSAELILDKIQQINSDDLPLVLMGDLNCTPGSKPIEILNAKLDDGLMISQKPLTGPAGTFNGFNLNDSINNRIDYIYTKNFKVISYMHLNDKRYNGYFISDHLPVLSEMKISK